jgi:hypothetical protein
VNGGIYEDFECRRYEVHGRESHAGIGTSTKTEQYQIQS